MRQTTILVFSLVVLVSAGYAQENKRATLNPMKPQSPQRSVVIPQPGGKIEITGFFRYENFSPRIWLKSSQAALVNITIKDSDGVSVNKGKVQLEKDLAGYSDLEEEHGGMITGKSYKIQLSAQYVEEAPTVTVTELSAPSVSVWYAMASKPERVTQIADVSEPWTLKITVNRAGNANLVFYDDQNLIPNGVSKQYAATGPTTDLNKHFDIDLKFFKDGYYRYHIQGGSDEQDLSLVDENESFLLIKDTKPVIEGLLKLEIKPDASSASLSFQLSQKIATELVFPGPGGLSIRVNGQGEKPPYTYNQVISTDAVDLIRKLTGAEATAAAATGTAAAGTAATIANKPRQPIELKLVAISGPHANEEIAEISLQGLQNNTAATTIAKLAAVKGTLKPADATNTAKEALGLQNQDTSKDPQASAVQYLAGLLTQRNSNKDKFLSFLAVAGNIALTYYGVPAKIPTKTN
jgi:hypothetical protein